MTDRLRLVTWNVHSFRGARGSRDPGRAARVLERLNADIVAGDLNIWWRGARAMRRLTNAVGPWSSTRTFPSRWPLVALDRVMVQPAWRRLSTEVASDDDARSASDHLPLWVDIRTGARRTSRGAPKFIHHLLDSATMPT